MANLILPSSLIDLLIDLVIDGNYGTCRKVLDYFDTVDIGLEKESWQNYIIKIKDKLQTTNKEDRKFFLLHKMLLLLGEANKIPQIRGHCVPVSTQPSSKKENNV